MVAHSRPAGLKAMVKTELTAPHAAKADKMPAVHLRKGKLGTNKKVFGLPRLQAQTLRHPDRKGQGHELEQFCLAPV